MSHLGICIVCNETLEWSTEDHFGILCKQSDGINEQNLSLFHPECFIAIAGKEWAARFGYKLKNVTRPPPEPINAGPIEPPSTTFSPNANVAFEYQDISFKIANCRVTCYNVDGERHFTVEEIKKK